MVFNLVNRVAPISIVHLNPRGLLLTCSTTLPVRAGDEIYPPKGGGFNLAYGNKKQKQWVWLAIDKDTGEIVGVFIGDRSQTGAKKLWDSLPSVYRQCAVCYTDFWKAYSVIFPAKRHKAVGKESGKTHKIERFNCTLRQRVSRLVRKTLSFSKTIENHIGAIWYFIHHYNRTLSIAT